MKIYLRRQLPRTIEMPLGSVYVETKDGKETTYRVVGRARDNVWVAELTKKEKAVFDRLREENKGRLF